MLSEVQLTHLEHIVHSISAALHVEEATLEAQQTLTLVLLMRRSVFGPCILPRRRSISPRRWQDSPGPSKRFRHGCARRCRVWFTYSHG